jgi:hypothetical protein
VVGGLVEQQDVRLRDQRPRERGPRQLAAREARQGPGQVLLGDPEAAQDALQPRAPGISAGALQARLCLFVGRQHGRPRVAAGHPGLQRGQLLLGAARVPEALGDVLLEGQVRPERRALVVEGDAGSTGQADAAGVRRELPGEDAQQGRLALAVAPHDGQALAGIEPEADPGEDVVRPECLADLDRLHSPLG